MNTSRICPSCQAPLPADAPLGLCPECLLKTAPASEAGHPPTPSLAEVAQRFPQLEILELLGQGGMGVVYKARQPRLDRVVALKILSTAAARSPSFTERFGREARALAKLSHPGIVAIYDFGNVGSDYFLLMEYVDGTNLRQMLQTGQVQPAEALALVVQICEALQFAHDQGVVHRDIKPGNILVDRKGRVKIADFGLAKLLDPSAADFTLTADHHVMGTPHYMAPEQMSHPLSVDHRADIYSLGVVFYEMLTGSLPVGRFEPPSQKVHVDVRLDEVVLRTLEATPARRYQHARDVGTDVASIQPGVTSSRPSPSPSSSPSPTAATSVIGSAWSMWWAQRHQLVARLLKAGLLVVYVLGLIGFFRFKHSTTATGLSRQVGAPTPWLHWENRFLGGDDGDGLGISFPWKTWAVLGAALLAFYVWQRVVQVERRLRWHDTIAHYVLWIGLFLGAFGLVVAPRLRPTTGLASLREIPSTRGHVSGGVRWSIYALEAPTNHRVKFWSEWLKDGKPVDMPGLMFTDVLEPARDRRIKGLVEFILQMEGIPRKGKTNQIEWQWQVRTMDTTSASRGQAEDPFIGLPRTDSSYGHQPQRQWKAGEEATVLVVRGDAEKLEGEPWDPAMIGRADLELRVKARIEPVPSAELRESPVAISVPGVK